MKRRRPDEDIKEDTWVAVRALINKGPTTMSKVGHKLVALARMADTDLANPSFLDCAVRMDISKYAFLEEFGSEDVVVSVLSPDGNRRAMLDVGIELVRGRIQFWVYWDNKRIFQTDMMRSDDGQDFFGLLCDAEEWENLENTFIGSGEGGASFLFRFLFTLCRHWGHKLDDQFGFYQLAQALPVPDASLQLVPRPRSAAERLEGHS